MKLIEKFMLKRCSTEVQVMLTRMKERPEDFDYGTGWRKLVELADDSTSPYTSTERVMIKKSWAECRHTRNRNELLGRIMSETINPTTRESLEDQLFNRRYTQALAASMQNTTQILQGGIASAHTDARSVYAQASNSGAQGAYGIYANPHNNAQGRIV